MTYSVPCPCMCGASVTLRSYYGRFGLSRGQAECADLAAMGKTDAEIAIIRHTTLHTSKSQIQHAFNKIGVSSRLELLLCAHQAAA